MGRAAAPDFFRNQPPAEKRSDTPSYFVDGKATNSQQKQQTATEMTEAELRKVIQQQVLQDLAGQEATHSSFAGVILINRKGLKHCISRRYNNPVARLLALPSAAELLTKATYLNKEADNHEPPRPGIFIHKLQAIHEIQGVSYNLWLYVRETPNSLHFYDLGIIE